MDHLFGSFSFLNRDSEGHELRRFSLRAELLILLLTSFASGGLVVILFYKAARLHPIDWGDLMILICVSLSCFRSTRIIYRYLGR